MCGIVGYVDFNRQPQRSQAVKMLETISYRGPDQKGIYIDKNVVIGIQRLSIIDLKTGDQPMQNEDKTVTAVLNGEIYNFLKLKSLLEEKGHKFKTKSDTEVLVHLYEVYGYEMSKYLKGMFAFAIWDKKKSLIFIARDSFGIKPLYFWQKGGTLLFGSELKSILIHPKVKKNINIQALKMYSSLGYIGGELSIFENTYKLLPGHNLIFSKQGKKNETFYELTKDRIHSGKTFDSILEESVISHAISDVPIGVFLSGGIDSSLVTYYLTKNIKKRINTFSIDFEEKSFDESYYAQIVAKQLRTKHHKETFNSKDVLRLFPIISQKLDEPLADPSLFPTFKVCALARKYVKVVLSGDGGDELFGGYPTYRGHLVADQFKKIVPQYAAKIILAILNHFPVSSENYPKTEILKEFLKGIHSTPFQRHLFWMSLKNYNQGLLNKELFKEDTNLENLDLLEGIIKRIESNSKDLVTKMQLLDFETYLKDDLLVKVDRASMYNSVEVRVPFLDSEVIENAFATTSHVSLFNTKKVLRSLLRDKFPSKIFNRPKKGFGIPLAKWILSDLENLIEEHLQNQRLFQYFDKRKVLEIWLNHKERKQDNSKLIWMITMFSSWLNAWY